MLGSGSVSRSLVGELRNTYVVFFHAYFGSEGSRELLPCRTQALVACCFGGLVFPQRYCNADAFVDVIKGDVPAVAVLPAGIGNKNISGQLHSCLDYVR